MPSSRGSSQPRDQTHVSCIGRWVLYPLCHLRSLSSPILNHIQPVWTSVPTSEADSHTNFPTQNPIKELPWLASQIPFVEGRLLIKNADCWAPAQVLPDQSLWEQNLSLKHLHFNQLCKFLVCPVQFEDQWHQTHSYSHTYKQFTET